MKAAAPKSRKNNFGFLRLLFAALVIVSHSSEMLDGDRSREVLTRIFGTLSFGDLAVDGFFLVSGYLVTLSLIQSTSWLEYLLKRILRIYPGFIVAFLFTLFVVGPLAGGTGADLRIAISFRHFAGRLLLLEEPTLKTAFLTLPYSDLNGSMWTLAYEFRCYCILMVLGVLGMLRLRKVFLAVLAILVVALVLQVNFPIAPRLIPFAGAALEDIRFLAAFCCGSCFYLFSDKVKYSGWAAAAFAVVLVPLMFVNRLAEAALIVFGGYILFWFAFRVKTEVIGRVGSRNDLSYGLYLYAWPVQNLLILHFRHIAPWLLTSIAVVAAGTLAYGSWVCVERPCLRLKGRLDTPAVTRVGRYNLPSPLSSG